MSRTLEQSGYKGWPYLHANLDCSPVVFVWWARSPTGRQSSKLHYAYFNRLRTTGKLKKHSDGHLYPVYVPTRHYGLNAEEMMAIAATIFPAPRLRKGYTWEGPFLYMSFQPAPSFGFFWNRFIAAEEPKTSDGIPLLYHVTVGKDETRIDLTVGEHIQPTVQPSER